MPWHHRSWADLRFQPSLDWIGGGVRGDCVAGELEYILPKYCDPVPRDGAAALRRGEKPFPSEKRLAEIDVRRLRAHTACMYTLHVHVHVHVHVACRMHMCMCTVCAPGADGRTAQP